MKVILIDANALIYRVYHALPYFVDHLGRPTNALYGLSNILLKLLEIYKPDYIFAIYDRPEPTFRHQVFKEYKKQRPPIKDDLKIQIGLSKKIFNGFNIPILEKSGYEADDIIATLKEKFKQIAEEIIILTGDLDTLQLVDKKTKVMTMKKGISDLQVYDEETVYQKFSIYPEQIPDFKALIGDKSDNIPGLKGVGEKTASHLLQKFKTVEKLIESAEEGKLDPSLRRLILDNKDNLLFFKNLLTLDKNVPIEINLDDFRYKFYRIDDLINVFKEFSFKSLIERIEKKSRENMGLFSKSSSELKEEIEEIKGNIKNLKSPFYLNLKDNKIEVYDKNLQIFELNDLKNLLKLPHEKIVYDFKNLLKAVLKDDFYFDKSIDLSKIFDLKLVFWLLNPDRTISSLEDILLSFDQKNNFYENILESAEILKKKLFEEELDRIYYEMEIKISPILARMELRGIKIDFRGLNEFKIFLQKKIEENLQEIYQLAETKFNPNSPLDLNEILFKKLKISPKGLKKTKTGLFSTQESELLKIKNSHPIIEKILIYRELFKLYSTYTKNFLKLINHQDNKIYTSFSQTTASTGRIISEKPNLQNLPLKGELAKEFRKIFIPEEGFVFISADYSQIELRILAHLSGDLNLITALKEGLDIHSEVAKYVFNEINEETRRKAKIINFGIVYGITAKGLSERLGVSLGEARRLIERFFKFYPEVKNYQEKVINFAKKNFYVETLFGRKRFLPEIEVLSYREKSEAERIAINFPIQGLGADIIKKAMIKIEEEILKKNWENKVFFVLQIHDELIFEVSEEIKDKFKVIIKEIMENVINLDVPLKVNISEGKNLGELLK